MSYRNARSASRACGRWPTVSVLVGREVYGAGELAFHGPPPGPAQSLSAEKEATVCRHLSAASCASWGVRFWTPPDSPGGWRTVRAVLRSVRRTVRQTRRDARRALVGDPSARGTGTGCACGAYSGSSNDCPRRGTGTRELLAGRQNRRAGMGRSGTSGNYAVGRRVPRVGPAPRRRSTGQATARRPAARTGGAAHPTALHQARPPPVHQPPRLPARFRAGAAPCRGADGVLGGVHAASQGVVRQCRTHRHRQRGGVLEIALAEERDPDKLRRAPRRVAARPGWISPTRSRPAPPASPTG